MKRIAKLSCVFLALCLLAGLSLRGQQATITITNPATGITVMPGQTLQVTVTRSVVADVMLVGDLLPGAGGEIKGGQNPLIFTVEVSAEKRPGKYRLIAISANQEPSALSVTSIPVDVIVDVGSTVVSGIAVEPSPVALAFPGDERMLQIFATTNSETNQPVRSSAGVTFISQNPTIATATAGRVIGVNGGNTKIAVRYKGVEAMIDVVVGSGIRGDFNSDGRVTNEDMRIIQGAIGSNANGPNDARDLNHDGKVDATDVQILNTLLTSPAVSCSYTPDRTAFSAAGIGDRVSVRVMTTAQCDWNAVSNESWTKAYPISAMQGNGRAYYAIGVNQNAPRSGSASVEGQTLTIWQAAANCSFTPTLPSTTIAPAGGTATLTITTTAGCAWKAVAAPAWVSFAGASEGTGSGTVQVSFAANTTSLPRTGLIEVGGQTINLVQQRSATPAPVAPFTDVPLTHPFADYITLMKQYGITSGCTATTYCPDDPVTRGQMAVFVVRAVLGGDNFPFSSSPYFTDVPASHPFFKWIQKMKELGITSGCTATAYCPGDPVTRGQMAAFVTRGRLGLTSTQTFPFRATNPFSDVPSTHPFFAFVQDMRESAITSGCTATAYCPDAPTTRGQMAAFIIRGFFTP